MSKPKHARILSHIAADLLALPKYGLKLSFSQLVNAELSNALYNQKRDKRTKGKKQ